MRARGRSAQAMRKVAKHAAFALVSLGIAHIILAYFVSLRTPSRWCAGRQRGTQRPSRGCSPSPRSSTETSRGFASSSASSCARTAGCSRLCSTKTRSSSAMTQSGASLAGRREKAQGDCVDCNRCVVVCPTGIDIRSGLQLDCVACTACIDACDDVMDRLGRPRGLDPLRLAGRARGEPRRIVRPRLVLYTRAPPDRWRRRVLSTRSRTDFEATASRLRGAPYTIDAGSLRTRSRPASRKQAGRSRCVSPERRRSGGGDAVLPVTRLQVESLGDAHVPLFLTMLQARFHGDAPVRVRVVREASGGRDVAVVPITFLGAAK